MKRGHFQPTERKFYLLGCKYGPMQSDGFVFLCPHCGGHAVDGNGTCEHCNGTGEIRLDDERVREEKMVGYHLEGESPFSPPSGTIMQVGNT